MQLAKSITKQVLQLGLQTYALKDANILSTNNNSHIFEVYLGKNNIEENKEHTYQNIYQLNQQGEISLLSEGKNTLNPGVISFSSQLQQSKYCAKLQTIPDVENKTKNNTILEIYKQKPNLQLLRSLNLTKYHDDVLNNEMVGSPLQWNLSENKLLYLAKPKPNDTKNFLQLNIEKEQDYETAMNYRKYRQDWGERMNEIYEANIYMFDVEKFELFQVQVQKQLFLTHPQFDYKDGIIVCDNQYNEFKHGIAHCFNRKSSIYQIKNPILKRVYPPIKEKQNEDIIEQQQQEVSQMDLISNDEVCRHPKVSRNKNKLVYFGTSFKHQHCTYLAIKHINLQNGQIDELVPVIDENLTLEARDNFEKRNRLFNGKCGYYDDLSNVFWANDDRHFIFNSISSAQKGIFILDTQTKEVTKLSHIDNKTTELQQILRYDSERNILFSIISSVVKPAQLGILLGLDKVLGREGSLSDSIQQLKLLRVNPQGEIFNQNNNELIEEFIYSGNAEGFVWRFKKQNIKDSERPLVVLIHGGPHGATLNQFTIIRYYLLSKGFTILAPNFTGSAGYGQIFFQELSGKIGIIDSKEIIDMIDQVRNSKRICDPNKTIAYGGSYGGFMGAILGSRYPNYFNGLVLANPALNLPFMLYASDIPEWCFSTTLEKVHSWNITSQELSQMFEISPISQPVKVPVLLLLGQKDKRCPYQQSLQFRAQCLANNTEIETYVYPESDHSLADSIHTSFDEIIKSLNFIGQKLKVDL